MKDAPRSTRPNTEEVNDIITKTGQNKKASNFDIIKGLGIHDRIA